MNYHQIKQWLFNNLWFGDNGEPDEYKLIPVSTVLPDTNRLWGTDISHWDGNVTLSVTKAAGAYFVFIKGLDGTLTVNYFVANRQRAIDAGLLHAPYQWLYRNVNVSCVAQARAADALLKKYPSDFPLVIDFEWTKYAGQASNPTWNDLDIYVTEFLRLGNRKPILYTASGYANTFGTIPAALKDKLGGLWIANYGVANPTLPYSFTAWDFWQFTSTGDPSLSPNSNNKKAVDLNYFNGDIQKLYALAGKIPPGEEGDMITEAQWNALLARLDTTNVKLDEIETAIKAISIPTTPTEPPVPPVSTDGYTGDDMGIYKIIEAPDQQTGNALTVIQDSYGNEITIVMDKMVDWMAANCPGWDNFVKNGSVVQGADGFWRYEVKLVKGQKVRIAEVGGKTTANPLGNGRIVGMDSQGSPARGAVNMEAVSPDKTPHYFHKITGQPWYFPIIQPRQQPQMAKLNAWWIPMRWLEKV